MRKNFPDTQKLSYMQCILAYWVFSASGGDEGYSSTPEVPINCLSYQIDVAQYH